MGAIIEVLGRSNEVMVSTVYKVLSISVSTECIVDTSLFSYG